MYADRIAVATAPAEEPLTLADAKLHLRVDYSDEDAYISSLIIGARQKAEEVTWRALVTQTLRLSLDCWPDGDRIALPHAPLQSVTSITYTDTDGNAAVLDSNKYHVSTGREPGLIVLKHNQCWPTVTLQAVDGIVIDFVTGYDGASAVPELLKQAMLLCIGHWHENREDVVTAAGVVAVQIPQGAQSIFNLYKAWC